MRKLYTTPEYKSWHKRHISNKNKRNRKYDANRISFSIKRSKIALSQFDRQAISAPEDFRLLENTEACLSFFRSVRSEASVDRSSKPPVVRVSLKSVHQIDYGTISIFTSLSDDLKTKNIQLNGDFPDDERCKKFIADSGFLNNLYDFQNRRFPKSQRSQFIFFEKGGGVLSNSDNIKISEMVRQVVNHLTGEEKNCQPVKTIILEICGNSIEWSGTDNKQWLLGVKYDDNDVIFTVTDVGKGILETLNRKFKFKIAETLTPAHEILRRAFDQRYGSNTQEINRNKGLPSVKLNFNNGTIQKLKVLTNNVILHFDNTSLSKTFSQGAARFKGTFYQWTMTKDCINKINNGNNHYL